MSILLLSKMVKFFEREIFTKLFLKAFCPEEFHKKKWPNLNWQYSFSRSSRPEVFCKKGVLRNFVKFSGGHLCQRLFLNKVAGLRRSTLLKKSLWHRCFPVNFAKFQRTHFLIEHLRWLLLFFYRKFHEHFNALPCQFLSTGQKNLLVKIKKNSFRKDS